jgi:peptidoglycan-N-acetylglucosamine deacetylase
VSTACAAISSDIDTLHSIYGGIGCRRVAGYSRTELRMGLESFSDFLAGYEARATLFVVGQDLEHEPSRDAFRAVVRQGHEIANHTMTHAQGFRLLSAADKERELAAMERACERVLGVRPVGFRSPGWNVGDDTLPILQRRRYLYDSSVFPTSLMPLLKVMHWRSMSSRRPEERTTLGHSRYMAAPAVPYRTRSDTLARRGRDGILEFPITVVPGVRLPFFATWLVATGLGVFRRSYSLLRAFGRPIQFMFHLSDFVDYGHPDLLDQVPGTRDGVYVPRSLRLPLSQKLDLFRRALDLIAADHELVTLQQWAEQGIGDGWPS